MTRTERNRLAFLTSTHVVDDLYQGAVPALLPFLAIERHYSYAGLTGITLAATFLASVVQPGFGALTDKYRNLGWLVAAGLLVAGLGIAVLFVAAFALGIVLFAPFAVQVTLGQDFLPNRIGMASGVTLGLAVSAGGVAAPLFGLLADSRGLTVALGTIAVFPAIACALTFLLRDPRGADETPGSGPSNPERGKTRT
jgi:MFS family permease